MVVLQHSIISVILQYTTLYKIESDIVLQAVLLVLSGYMAGLLP